MVYSAYLNFDRIYRNYKPNQELMRGSYYNWNQQTWNYSTNYQNKEQIFGNRPSDQNQAVQDDFRLKPVDKSHKALFQNEQYSQKTSPNPPQRRNVASNASTNSIKKSIS
jgi:hypothetical protein